jgi:hypothetical protein
MRLSGVELTIDTLVLDGFPAADGALVRDAAEAELAQMLVTEGLPPDFGRPRDAGGSGAAATPVLPGTPESLGRQIAHHVYARLTS